MRMIKIYLVLLMMFSYLNAGDEIQKVINVNWNEDISKRYCVADCGTDESCKSAENICKIMIKLPLSTIDKELFNKALRVISSAITGTINFAVEKKFMKFNDVAGFYTYLDDALPTYFGSKKFPNKAKIFNATDVIEFFIDTGIDIYIEYTVESMTTEDFNFFRSLPGIHDNASNETIKQAFKWMMTLAKNDAKAWAMASTGDYSGLFTAGVVDNGFLLLDIGVQTTSEAQDLLDAKTALAKSQKIGEIMQLRTNMESSFYKEDNNLNKVNIMNNFTESCNKIQLSTGQFIVANWAKILQGYGASINSELRIKCSDYSLSMYRNDGRKQYLARTTIHTMSRINYAKLINHYYPDKEKSFYMRLYDVENFVPEIGATTSEASYEYLKKLYAHATMTMPKKYLDPTQDMSMSLAANTIRIALKKKFGIIKSPSEIVEGAGYTQYTTLTRKRYSKLLVDNLQVANVKLDKNPKATFIQWSLKKRPYYDARLAAFEIIPSNEISNDTTYALMASRTVKYYTLVQMLADALDVVTCGHKGCSYEDILKDLK